MIAARTRTARKALRCSPIDRSARKDASQTGSVERTLRLEIKADSHTVRSTSVTPIPLNVTIGQHHRIKHLIQLVLR
jgi:hypothetical protein